MKVCDKITLIHSYLIFLNMKTHLVLHRRGCNLVFFSFYGSLIYSSCMMPVFFKLIKIFFMFFVRRHAFFFSNFSNISVEL